MHKKFDELRLTGALPSPSSIGLRILELTKDEEYDQKELTQSIMADPALAGRIIKLANSALHGGVELISTVPEAAMRIGRESVRTVALGFTLISDNRNGSAESFQYDTYWSRCLAMAVANNALAYELGAFDPTEAFTCGLLCDVGMLALASVHPQRYSALIEACPEATSQQLAELESQAFDIDHCEVGAAMMEDWGLPSSFRRAVHLHEKEREETDGEDEATIALTGILRGAKAVAALLVSERDESNLHWCRRFFGLERLAVDLGMEHRRLLQLCDAIASGWEEWGRAVGVTATSPFRFVETADELVEQRQSFQDSPVLAPIEIVNRERLLEAVATPSLETASSDGGDEAKQDEQTRILLIDDDQRMLKLIRHHLAREGYEVITAESSKEGLRQAFDLQPQIVISDWMMPGMTGVQLCRTLRQSEPGRKMYVLIVTAREDDEQVVEAFGAGADDYIVKPFNPRILLARVRAGQRMILMRQRLEAAEQMRLRQVAELGILTRKLRAAAMTDPLTELPNRRYAMKRLKQEWDGSLRTGRPLSVVVADVDYFKSVNDDFGHDAGDAVLREVATVLRVSSRSGDVLCRLGGEEFLSINLACSSEEAVYCAERLRTAIEGYEIQYPGLSRQITVSFGVAERTSEMTSPDDLIKEADQALYDAKKGGRNCTACDGVIYRPPRRKTG